MTLKKIYAIVALVLAFIGTSTYITAVELENEMQQPITITPNYENLISAIPQEVVDELEQAENADAIDAIGQRLKEYAAKFLGTRYVWGATGPKSFDCSGFVGYVFRNEGISLPRTSSMQYREGEKVSHKELRPGDLLFFSSRRSGKGRVGHVAMVTDVNPDGSCTFIHASTRKGVVYQKFPDGGYYSRNFVGAKRVIETDDLS